jgi:ribose transport system substrate-binding protein
MKRSSARLAVALTVLLGCVACGRWDRAPLETTIAVIPKGTSHVFWQSVRAGADRAAQELGVSVIWRGPLREDDRDSQISEVEGFISRGVSGIVLAPLDEAALAGPVADAARRRIPVVIIDSGLKGTDYVSFVATDNDRGGRLAGERLAEVMHGAGTVVLLRYAEGHESTSRREEGFLDAIREHPGIEVISSNQYGGTDVEGYHKRAEALLARYKRADGTLGVGGLFCPNESSAFAMLRVLQDNGWAGKVRFVGFDSSVNLVAALRAGELDGLVLQDPVRMGYLGVRTLVAHLRGEPVDRRIDTGVQVATRENMDQPAIRSLLHPDLPK